MKRSKRYRAQAEKVDEKKTYSIEEATKLVQETASTKFAENVDIAIKLDIDSKKSDQLVRGAFSLPHGTGQDVSVVAFVPENLIAEAKEAGAIEAGGEELAQRIEGGWLDFDVVIAHPSMMRFVGKLGKVLGPQGKMPSPKSGTVSADAVSAVKEFKSGKVEFRNDDAGNIQIPIGKANFSNEQITENAAAFVKHVLDLKPAAVKGSYMTGVTLSATMGPGVRVAV